MGYNPFKWSSKAKEGYFTTDFSAIYRGPTGQLNNWFSRPNL